MARKLTIIFVPDEHGEPHQLKLQVIWLKVLGGLLAIAILLIAAAALSYTSVARKALDHARVVDENRQLELENRRIVRVAREVDQSRQILAQIIRSLGGHLDLGRTIETDTALKTDHWSSGGELSVDARELLDEHSFIVERSIAYDMPTLMPVDGFISQRFTEDFLFRERSHHGIDIAAKSGTPIRAAASGRVVFSGWTPHFGNCLFIAHRGGYLTFYGHNQVNLKNVREEVARGEPVGLVGTSGRSSAPHLHFEIWKDGVAVDPLEFVQPDSVSFAGM